APAGITDDEDIRTASSIIDYIFKRLGKTYLSFDDQLEVGLASIDDVPTGQSSLLELEEAAEEVVAQAEQEIAAEAPDVTETSTAAAFAASASTSQPAALNIGDEPAKKADPARQD